jgi:hypothetical protein
VGPGSGDADGLVEAWSEAATDLDIRIEVPTTLDIGGLTGEFPVRILDFGSVNGMVLALGPSEPRLMAALRGEQQGFSYLNESYCRYDRELFISALNDWGWSGDGAPPDWYTG